MAITLPQNDLAVV